MDFPHGHTHHQSHHRRDDREEEYPPPPPHVRPPFDPYYNEPPPPLHARPPYDPYINEPPPPVRSAVDPYYNQPPPPQVTHVHHESSYPNYQPPPPQVAHVSHVGHESHPSYPPPNTDYYNPPPPRADPYPPPPRADPYPPPPRADPYPSGSTVQHVSHESGENNAHHFKPHMPSFISGQTHHQGPDVVPNRKPTVRLFSKAETNYSLSIRDGKVILAPSNPSDPLQHWIKDERFSTKVKDEQGFPSFALINEATGQAMKHSIGATHPVQLIPFNPDRLDESILWTLSKDLGDGYRTIRMVNNIRLNVDAFNGDQNHGGVHDGTKIVLWEWLKGENQRWKIIPY